MSAIGPAPLHGEILGDADYVRVVAALHPFRAARVELLMPTGLSIAEMIAALPTSRMSRRLDVSIDGEPIFDDVFARVRPKAGCTVTIKAVAQGGKGGIGTILMIAVAIAALVIAPWAAGAMFAAGSLGFGIAQAVIGGAITIGGGALICATFPANPLPTSIPPSIRKSS